MALVLAILVKMADIVKIIQQTINVPALVFLMEINANIVKDYFQLFLFYFILNVYIFKSKYLLMGL